MNENGNFSIGGAGVNRQTASLSKLKVANFYFKEGGGGTPKFGTHFRYMASVPCLRKTNSVHKRLITNLH